MDPIEQQFRAGYPLFRIVTLEEESATHSAIEAAKAVLGETTTVLTWDAAVGLEPQPPEPASLDDVLEFIAHDTGPTLLVVKDIHRFFDVASVRRRLFRLASAIANRPVRVALLSPPGELDEELQHRIPSVRYSLPDDSALRRVATEELGTFELVDDTSIAMVAAALRGLTQLEARATLRRGLVGSPPGRELLERLFESKARRIEGQALQYHPPSVRLDDVGGLKALKDWALIWARDFRNPELSPLDAPKGVLLTGVSGCGKSYAIKALSHTMASPLFRLDMAQVFARRNPEAAFATAIAAVEALAPCILWIDEIENALALGTQDSGQASRIAGGFLTWMQERQPGIFLAATANRVELLPAELLRRGRFDQILFVDLPNEEERKRVWSAHLQRRAVNPAHFDLIVLARATEGWSGAEIEAGIEVARAQCRIEGDRALTREDLLRSIGKTIPLSVTMQEQIRRVREWAFKRALPASGRPW